MPKTSKFCQKPYANSNSPDESTQAYSDHPSLPYACDKGLNIPKYCVPDFASWQTGIEL